MDRWTIDRQGKSTLVHCLAALETPTAGSVVPDGVEVAGRRDTALPKLRRDRVGLVFQSFNLLYAPAVPTAHQRPLPREPQLVISGRTVSSSRTPRPRRSTSGWPSSTSCWPCRRSSWRWASWRWAS